MVWSGMRRLVGARRSCAALHGGGVTKAVRSGHRQVFAWQRDHARHGTVLGVANVSAEVARFDYSLLAALGERIVEDLLAPGDADFATLAGFQVRWLTSDRAYRTVPPPPTDAGSRPHHGDGQES